jgi:DNA-binding NarL/FixJ family response regulator
MAHSMERGGGVSPLESDSGNAKDILTQRQLQVLLLIANGKNTKEIADILRISFKTVGCHRSNIMRRLNIHAVAGLVRYSIRHGLVKM